MTQHRFPKGLRHLLFALLPALILLLLLELVCLVYYFHRRGSETFALQAAFHDLKAALAPAWAQRTVHELDLPPAIEIYDELYSSDGTQLLAEFKRRYEALFGVLAGAVSDAGARFVVLYVPPAIDNEISRRVDRHDRAFYRRLAGSHGVDFLDAAAALAPYPNEQTRLLPHNIHLSRLGNQVLAEWLARHLDKPPYRGHRSSVRSEDRPDLLGDLPPGTRRVWTDRRRPYRVTTNAQGLRMDRELTFPKQKQRILLLGDSFTFGKVDDVDTYPAFLQARLPGREVINAGVSGYSILQWCKPWAPVVLCMTGLLVYENGHLADGAPSAR